MKNKGITYFLVCKARSNDDVGGAMGTFFRSYAVGLKTGDFVKEKLGGATIERLRSTCTPYGILGPTARKEERRLLFG